MLAVHLPGHAPLDRCGNVLDVQKPASASTAAPRLMEGPAASLAEISHWRILRVDQLPKIEAAGEPQQSPFGIFLVVELDIHVADHVFHSVVHDNHLFDLPIIREYQDDLRVEGLEVLLCPVVHVIVPRLVVTDRQRLGWVRVHVGQQQRPAGRGTIVLLAAEVPVATCSDLKVEGAIDGVLLSAKNSGKLLRHQRRGGAGASCRHHHHGASPSNNLG
mmetsp:Transcript_15392/g.42236  ORF Transcript_15392/g.42236 Transcript_15392/m.42236 type:complete len:218 (-) Transcript_15392:72-725(-)